jgi:predicted dehydrogenase
MLTAAVVGLRHPHIVEFLRAAAATPGVALAGIAEDVERLRAPAAAAWDVPVFASYRELLDRVQPDVVGLAVTNAAKADVAAECLERGVHVIADKPLVTDDAGLRRLRGVTARGGPRLSAMLACRFLPGYRAVRSLIDAGTLGEVAHLAAFGPHRLRPATREPWMLDDALSGGILVDLGIHYVDLLRWYSGEEAATVFACHGTRRFPDIPGFVDHGHAVVTFPGGAAGYVSVDWLTPEASPVHGDYRLDVTGTRGVCELRVGHDGAWRLTVTTDDQPPSTMTLPPAETTASRDFLEAVRDGREPFLSQDDVLRSSELALRVRHAADSAPRLGAPKGGDG